jgi:predicted Rossmann fold nucleotide-binding protein DprA/Smf involved in DNA uptake
VLDLLYGPGVRRVPAAPAPTLEPRLARLLAAVERGATVDSLARGGEEVGSLLAALTELELLGLVRRAAGGAYLRCAGADAYA